MSFMLTMEVVAGYMSWVARPMNVHLQAMSECKTKGISLSP